jgi:hypothetical protein
MAESDAAWLAPYDDGVIMQALGNLRRRGAKSPVSMREWAIECERVLTEREGAGNG